MGIIKYFIKIFDFPQEMWYHSVKGAEEYRMYRTLSFQINRNDSLFDYFDDVAHKANNMYNAVLFRIRQLYFAYGKTKSEMSDNERQVYDEAFKLIGSSDKNLLKSGFANYKFINAMMVLNHNPDYYAEDMTAHTAQQVIKQVLSDFKGFFESLKKYNADPSSYLGRPHIPNYRTKGGVCTFKISNQESYLYTNKKDRLFLKLPGKNRRMKLGKTVIPDGFRLMEVNISYENNHYNLNLVLSNDAEEQQIILNPKRVAAIDFGVNNFMAVVNNFGSSCLLFNGKPLKSVNQWCNKQIADMMSRQTKVTKEKFVPTNDYYRVLTKRNNTIHDFIHKTAKQFVNWCTENRVDTVVLGHTAFWKQKSKIGKVNNQNFVEIPFYLMQFNIKYLCEREGIAVIEQEESYTSQASFLDGDFIPVYQKGNNQKYQFSGNRVTRSRYVSKNGTAINADLNGAANILRKAVPEAFVNGTMPNFSSVELIKHPDYFGRMAVQVIQKRNKENQHQHNIEMLTYFHQK